MNDYKLDLKYVLYLLEVSYEYYIKKFGKLFPIINENDEVVNNTHYKILGKYIEEKDPQDKFYVDFRYLNPNKNKNYQLRNNTILRDSYYDENIIYTEADNIDIDYLHYLVTNYPHEFNIVNNISKMIDVFKNKNTSIIKEFKNDIIDSYYPESMFEKDTKEYDEDDCLYNVTSIVSSSDKYHKINALLLNKIVRRNISALQLKYWCYALNNTSSTTPTPKKVKQMTKSTTLSTLTDVNKTALITATKLEVGTIALDIVTEQLLKTLPEPLRTMISTNPASKILVSNLVNVLVTNTNITDERLLTINESMMTVGYMEFFKTFDIQGILTDVLTKIPDSKLDTLKKDKEK